MSMKMKKLPVGKSDFKQIIQENYCYVDKTLFIKEVMDKGDSILVIPRPRRFGKTLNLSMLKYFYDRCPEEGVEILLKDFNVPDMYDQVREWYNGYYFGKRIIYRFYPGKKVNWALSSNLRKPGKKKPWNRR